MREPCRRMLLDLLALPTAPFHEHAVIDYVRRWAAHRPQISLRSDRSGNLKLDLHIGKARPNRPLYFAAHMDHPGFVAVRMQGSHELLAKWYGGVQPDFFDGAGVRFHDGRRWVRGKVKSYEIADVMGRRRVSEAVIEVRHPVPPGAVGMWDLPDPVIRGARVYARGCDDMAGVAAILATLDELVDAGTPVRAGALLTRAEEVGFAGAIAACESGFIPRQARVLSVECSPVQPGVTMGAGPVLRVGDRMSVFSSSMDAWCRKVAESFGRKRKDFAFQRKLLDGGACESTAYMEYGYETTGVSLPLGNYHNMNRRTGRIAAEYVDLNDFDRMVCWFASLATAEVPKKTDCSTLRQTFARELRTWKPMLEQTLEKA